MICNRCGREVKRVCRDCQAVQARRGMLMHQRRFLQTWLAGAIDLRVRDYQGATHLELFDDPWHGYCGAALFDPGGSAKANYDFPTSQRRRSRELPADLCSECTKIFNELVATARSEVR